MSLLLDHLLIKKHRGCYLKYLATIYQVQVETIAEIGVFRGKNSEVLREEFPNAHLYLIDPWAPSPSYLASGSAVAREKVSYIQSYEQVKRKFGKDPRATILRMAEVEAAPLVPDRLDLVFLDANHDYRELKRAIATWIQKVRPKGILAGHNYGRKRLPGVKQAVDETFGNHFLLGQDEVWAHFKLLPN